MRWILALVVCMPSFAYVIFAAVFWNVSVVDIYAMQIRSFRIEIIESWVSSGILIYPIFVFGAFLFIRRSTDPDRL